MEAWQFALGGGALATASALIYGLYMRSERNAMAAKVVTLASRVNSLEANLKAEKAIVAGLNETVIRHRRVVSSLEDDIIAMQKDLARCTDPDVLLGQFNRLLEAARSYAAEARDLPL